MKNFAILETRLIGRKYSIKAYTEDEAIESYHMGEGKLIREKLIDRHMEEVKEEE